MRVTFSSTVFGADLLQVGLEQIADLLRILIGHEPHADLGHRRRRQHGLGALAGEPGQQSVDFERRPRPHALERRVAALAEQLRRAELLAVLRLVERQLLPLRALRLAQRPHIVVEAGNLDAAAAILHLREDLGEHERRVGDGAAERARVQIALRAAQVDLEVGQPAQAVADRRNAAIEHRRVRDDDDVGGELLLVRRTKSSRCTLPTSSSPSMKNLMFSGRLPACFRCASTALMCMNTWPLSSAAPRA